MHSNEQIWENSRMTIIQYFRFRLEKEPIRAYIIKKEPIRFLRGK